MNQDSFSRFLAMGFGDIRSSILVPVLIELATKTAQLEMSGMLQSHHRDEKEVL